MIFILLVTIFLTALVIPFLAGKIRGSVLGVISALFPAAAFITAISKWNDILSGPVIESYQWIPSLGLEFSFQMDILGLIFFLLISGIGFVVFLYAGSYLENNPGIGKFYASIFVFMGAMLGVVTADNLILLFIFWELTSLSSFFLIGFKHNYQESRYAAQQALLVTGLGGLALLAGFIMITIITGASSVSGAISKAAMLQGHSLTPFAITLIFIGAFTKSAQFPFHFWLPNAMAAPSPVSAYLHSATMVKAGVFLAAKLTPLFLGIALWFDTLLLFGGITMIVAVSLAIKQQDLKKLLAYTTVGMLGTLMFLLGTGSEYGMTAFLLVLVSHSLYKATLFLTSGNVDHGAGTRDILKLGGLRRVMPMTTTAATLAAVSMLGVMPFLGFLGKEYFYKATSYDGFFSLPFAVAIFSAAIMVMVGVNTGILPFFRKNPAAEPEKAHEVAPAMWFGPLLLGVVGLFTGLFSESIFDPAAATLSKSLRLSEQYATVSLWHGFNVVLLLSVITIIVGFYLAMRTEAILGFLGKTGTVRYLHPSFWYDAVLKGTLLFAEKSTKILQNGYLRYYILMILVTALIFIVYTISGTRGISVPAEFFTFSVYEGVLAAVMMTATFFSIHSSSRLAAIVSLGIIGYGVSIFFIFNSAPDLATTQFAIETLTVLLFVLVVYKLPPYIRFTPVGGRIRDFFIAIGIGIMTMVIMMTVMSNELNSPLKQYYLEQSYPGGQGRNIVNVILVDFRALDTLGEITVLAIAALGVFTLLKISLKGRESL